jgi:non-heme chloroperoxidase
MPRFTATTTPGTRIYYDDSGGHGRPVVLIHGWPLSHRMWEGQVNALTAAGYRCVSYDRRGFGQSDRPTVGYDYDTLADDLNDLVRTLALKDAVLVGFSMGGGEVARYLSRYGHEGRVAGAAFVAAVPPFLLKTDDNPEGVDGAVFDQMLAGVRENRIRFLSDFLTQFFNLDADGRQLTPDELAYVKSLAWMASPLATQQCITAFGTTDFREDLATITVPTLVVHGDADRIVPLEVSGRRTASLVSGSRLAVIEGAPHGLTATHGDALNRLLIDFLGSV